MSTDIKTHLLGKVKNLTERNKELLDGADAAVRDMTDQEQAEFKTNMKQVAELQVEIKAIEDREEMRAQLDAIAPGDAAVQEPTVEVQAKTIGEAFVRSAEYKMLVDRYRREGDFGPFKMPPISLKAVGDAILLGTGNNQDAVQPGWDPTLYTPSLVQFPLRVRDLLSQVQASGNITHYPVVTTRTAPSDNPTTEGAAKKGVEFAFDDGTVTLEKNTAFGGASDELFADAPALAGYMTNQIGLMVDQVEEAAITTVLYAAITEVDGDEYGTTSPNGFDAIRAAMAAIEIAGGVPDGILIHPGDAAFLDTLQASNVGYLGDGPTSAPRTAWWGGLRLVKTTSADPGRPIVGAFRAGATLYTRGGTTVETSNSHDDYFAKDLVAIRAYRRSKAVKHYPEWFKSCVIGVS